MVITKNKDYLKKLFHLKRDYACRNMDCGITHLKIICRRYNIKRWPSRQIAPLRKYILQLSELKKTNDNVLIDEYLRYLEYIKTSISDNTELKLKDFVADLPKYIKTLMTKLDKK